MSASRIAAVGLALGAAAGLAGCSSGSADAGDPVIWHDWDENSPAMLALVSTTLVLENGCLQGQEGLLAFPRDYGEWDAENGVLQFGDSTYAPGDEISAGGGGGALTEDMTIPAGCDAAVGDPVFLIQSTNLG